MLHALKYSNFPFFILYTNRFKVNHKLIYLNQPSANINLKLLLSVKRRNF